MNVGDIRMCGTLKVRIEKAEADPAGNIPVTVLRDDGEYASVVAVDSLSPVRATWRATHPEFGNVTIDLPTDGVPEVRAVWSQAATDAATKG